MAALVSMTPVLQASDRAIEVTSSVADISVSNSQQSSGEANTNSGFSNNSDYQSLLNLATNLEVDVQTRFNEIRSELLDERASYIDLWLTVIGLFLGLFAVVVPIAGIMGFRRFREIEKETKTSAESAAAAAATAEHDLQEIRKKSDTATDLLKGIDAKSAAENPMEATRTVKNVQDDPYASLIDKAIADAVSLQQQNKQEDAIEKWRAIAQITEGSDNAVAARAWFSVGYLSSAEDVGNTISSYDRVIQLKPNFFEAYVNRGIAKAELGRHEDALVDYDKAIELNPDRAGAYFNRGITKAKLGRQKDTLADFDKAIELNPDRAKFYANRGIAKSKLRRHEDALADFDKAIELNPDRAKFYADRAITKVELGRHEDALADFDRAIELNSDMPEAYTNRAITKAELGRHEDTLADYDKAIELNPDRAKFYEERGIAKFKLRRYEDALADFDKSIELNSEDAYVHQHRAFTKMNLGFYVEAKLDLETALEIAQNSNNVDLVNKLEQILHNLGTTNGD